MTILNDAFGKTLIAGDIVVYSNTQGETSSLKSGEVIGFTAKKVRLSVDNWSWRVEIGEPLKMEILKFPEQIARIN